MYEKPNKKLWTGRIDKEDGKDGFRFHQKIKFIKAPYQKEKGLVLLGFDCDEGVKRNKGRLGAGKACDILKTNMGNLAYHLKNTRLYDGGKFIADENLEKNQEYFSEHVENLLKNNHFPLILGGGHETAYASFLGLHKAKKENIAIINFDAHFDLRLNNEATSGTPFEQISSLCKKDNTEFSYMCLGIATSSNTKALFKKAKELNVEYIEDNKMNLLHIKRIKKDLDKFLKNHKNIYITIDTDVISSYILKAVSAPASKGLSLEIIYEVLEYLFKKYKNRIKLLDITEFNPLFDENNLGAKIISRLIYDIINLRDKYK
ncbi:MAG: formimidoylglutamase [Campylobacterales bacterium]|nr:formimidoylglutamase [Campylobacterales bacterium]